MRLSPAVWAIQARRWPLHLILSLLLVLTAAVRAAPARHGMVVTDDRRASEVGLSVLRRGGNAVDAAVAVALALAVVYPEAGNLGGGGFMLIRRPNGAVTCVDFRETAPRAATRGVYMHARPGGEGSSTVGYRAVGTPGTPAGLDLAWRKYGSRKIPWAALVAPARRLAAEGFRTSPGLARDLAATPQLDLYPDGRRIFRGRRAGQILRQPELAATLARLARGGAREFYHGRTARLIAADMARHHGLLTASDLADYRAKERAPLEGTYRGYRVITVPPPSSGGAVLLEMLNMLEAWHGGGNPEHVLIEVMRRAFADRGAWFGDPDFVALPIRRLISKAYARQRVADIDPNRATPRVSAGHPIVEPNHTTHFSVVDAQGGAVSCTYTLNNSFGSGVVASGTGVLLNDEMDDFTTGPPGHPNLFGLVQSEKNAVAPRHRPVSSMTPTMVLRPDGRLFLVLGSPGGPTIITSVLQVILHVIDGKMSLADAIRAPRLHHQWLPDRVEWEAGVPARTRAELARLGHPLADRPRSMGDVKAVEVDERGGLVGASDHRRRGAAVGF